MVPGSSPGGPTILCKNYNNNSYITRHNTQTNYSNKLSNFHQNYILMSTSRSQTNCSSSKHAGLAGTSIEVPKASSILQVYVLLKGYLLGLRYLIWLYNTNWWIVGLNKYLLAKNNIKKFLNIFFKFLYPASCFRSLVKGTE